MRLNRLPSSSVRYSHNMRPLTAADVNPAILKVQYAVRGELAIKAEELREKLQDEKHDLPFKKVISSNIGNPQQKGLDQPFLTFTRQVAALMEYPPLAELVKGKWPQDVLDRAKELQTDIGSIGAYSHSKGVPLIRKHVAKFIQGTHLFFPHAHENRNKVPNIRPAPDPQSDPTMSSLGSGSEHETLPRLVHMLKLV